jgi:hypothetical protein
MIDHIAKVNIGTDAIFTPILGKEKPENLLKS